MKIETLADFKSSLSGDVPPEKLSVYGKALWWMGKGNWKRSHDLIQNVNDRRAAQIHAYLHRFEGDLSNAQYWYSKANTSMPDTTIDQEWESLVIQFI
jgi:hypothetical protein